MAVAEERTERDVAHGPGGLKAEAGLRGPYGTSVRHIWPTWTLLVAAVTLISAPLSLSLPFSFSLRIFLKKLSFLDLTQISHHAFHPLSTISRFLAPSVSFHLRRHLSRNPSFFVFFFLTYVHYLPS